MLRTELNEKLVEIIDSYLQLDSRATAVRAADALMSSIDEYANALVDDNSKLLLARVKEAVSYTSTPGVSLSLQPRKDVA